MLLIKVSIACLSIVATLEILHIFFYNIHFYIPTKEQQLKPS